MHPNSIRLMRSFLDRYGPVPGSVLDVGSGDVNGTYRPLFGGWSYWGVDIAPGPNVDQVVAESGWSLGRSFDLVISGQCLEHCARPWELAKIMGHHLKPGGLICLIAPFAWKEHRHPLDCWRIGRDGMAVLLLDAGCSILEVSLSDAGESWHIDCVGIGRKIG